jgi:hypothetical protein
MKYFALTFAIASALVFSVIAACAGADGDPAPQPAEGGSESAAVVPCTTSASDGGSG